MIISEREAELAQAVEMGSELVERIKSLNETVGRLECELDSSKRETSEVDEKYLRETKRMEVELQQTRHYEYTYDTSVKERDSLRAEMDVILTANKQLEKKYQTKFTESFIKEQDHMALVKARLVDKLQRPASVRKITFAKWQSWAFSQAHNKMVTDVAATRKTIDVLETEQEKMKVVTRRLSLLRGNMRSSVSEGEGSSLAEEFELVTSDVFHFAESNGKRLEELLLVATAVTASNVEWVLELSRATKASLLTEHDMRLRAMGAEDRKAELSASHALHVEVAARASAATEAEAIRREGERNVAHAEEVGTAKLLELTRHYEDTRRNDRTAEAEQRRLLEMCEEISKVYLHQAAAFSKEAKSRASELAKANAEVTSARREILEMHDTHRTALEEARQTMASQHAAAMKRESQQCADRTAQLMASWTPPSSPAPPRSRVEAQHSQRLQAHVDAFRDGLYTPVADVTLSAQEISADIRKLVKASRT